MLPEESGQELPVAGYREEIVATVGYHAVTIITAETGAGKSTQVPKYLLQAGYNVVVTQPRRLAARTVAARVADELGEKLGGSIGYRTAESRIDSHRTRCLFVTDGLALVRELMGKSGNNDVLILDEVHEWNLSIEILVGWAKRQIASGAKFKLVIMSATMEAEKLSAFFNAAPVVTVPGRVFPVDELQPSVLLEDDVAKLVREGRNVLVFQPGKAEIRKCITKLAGQNINAELLELHGELNPDDQDRCFKHYGRPKVVVATNVAQTSITVDDIDAVVDSGMERRTEVVDGVEGLYIRPISLADGEQRKGRAGRTKPGVYIDHCAAADRLDYPTAEVLRVRLDMTVLRLLMAGIDMEELELFHQPSRDAIHAAKRALTSLGCITAAGEVTPTGKQVAKLPLSANIGRMVVEAIRLGVLEDVITIAAIIEVGGIVDRRESAWRMHTNNEQESDLLAQLSVFKAAEKFKRDPNPLRDEFRQNGVFGKMYFRVREIIRNIKQNGLRDVEINSTGRREDILKAVCAGMVDHLYRYEYGRLRNGDMSRELARESVVRIGMADRWFVGKPFDLEVKAKRGGTFMIYLVQLVSKVKPEWLAEVAPQLASEETGIDPYFNRDADSVVSTTKLLFNGSVVDEKLVDHKNHPQAAEIFAAWLAAQIAA